MKCSIIIGILLCCSSCFKGSWEGTNTIADHSIFDSLLKKHVDREGLVDYSGFEKDQKIFETYLHYLKNNPPSPSWIQEEKLAYWINAYNAFTISLILQEKPKTSIKDITTLNIPFLNSPWQIDFIQIQEKTYNLDDIEHGIIRKEFNEPRIHFALVCAAKSCPKLRMEAYTGANLDCQLTEQTRNFLANNKKNEIHHNHLKLSKIFDWYKRDFTKDTSLIDFINKHSTITIAQEAKIEFIDYCWELNSQ